MTANNPAGWLQNAGATHTAAQMRTYVGSTLGGISSAGALTTSRGGVNPLYGTQMVVTQNGTPNMSVNVGAGIAYVPGSESNAQGTYFCYNDATVNLSIATAPGAGSSRIDLVVAKVQDSQYSGATDAWSLAVVTGTASASPSAPTAPNNSLILAQIAVGSNVTSIVTANITDKRVIATGLGGMLVAPSTNMPTIAQLQSGQIVYVSDTNKFQYINGSVYSNMSEGIILGGVVQAAITQTGLSAEVLVSGLTTPSIVLPPNRYIRVEVKTPSCQLSTGSGGAAVFRIRETNISGTDVGELQVSNFNSTIGQSRGILRGDFNSGAGATKIYCVTVTLFSNGGGGGTLSLGDQCSILVHDMGPSSRVSFI